MVVLDKLTYAGRRENLEPATTAELRAWATSRTPRPSARRWPRAATPSSTSPPSRTSTARSRSQDAFVPHARARHRACCSRRRASAASALPPGLHRRGLRLDRRGLVHRGLAARPVLPLLGDQGRRRPARVGAYHHTYGIEALICRGSNNYGPHQYPEKLIPLCDPERARTATRCRSTATACRCATGSTWRTSAAASTRCSSAARPGEVYNVGGPDECENIEVVQRDPRADRPRRVADRVRHRPPRPRPPLLAQLGEAARRARLGGAGPLRRGPRSGRSTGTATTRSGGSRSARASTATTTRGSTAGRSASSSPR